MTYIMFGVIVLLFMHMILAKYTNTYQVFIINFLSFFFWRTITVDSRPNFYFMFVLLSPWTQGVKWTYITFKRRLRHLLNVLCTFNAGPTTRGLFIPRSFLKFSQLRLTKLLFQSVFVLRRQKHCGLQVPFSYQVDAKVHMSSCEFILRNVNSYVDIWDNVAH